MIPLRARVLFLSLGMGLCFGVWGMAWGATICRVNPFPMRFGAYDPFSPFSLTATSRIAVKCNAADISFRVSLDSGQNAIGFQPRRLNSPAGQGLDYNLYRDPAHTEIWGDGTPPTVIQQGTSSKGAKPRFTLYGRIPASQNVTPDRYTDTVRVTVEW